MLLTILAALIILYLLLEWNMGCYHRFVDKPIPDYPSVSVLVPCRNEAHQIRRNVESLLSQDYPDFEIVVYDDDSQDGSLNILQDLARRDSRLRVIGGRNLPPGWTGKNFACAELARAARGEWILFVDADTAHENQMLRRAMETVVHRRAAFLSTFPKQRFSSTGDEMVIPLMLFVFLCFLPLYFVPKRTWRWLGDFSAACGQFLLFRKDAYVAAGGHEAIKDKISEGLILASRVKEKGYRIILADGSPWVSCSMYRGLRAAVAGFSRSIFASMGGSFLTMVFFLLFQTFVFLVPYGTLAFSLSPAHFSGGDAALSLAAVFIPLWMRYRIHDRLGMPKRLVALHAVSILIYNVVIINSFIHFRIRRKTVWKDRSYANPQL